MSDYGAEYTEEQIKELEKKIKKVYSQANSEIKKKADDFSKKFARQDKENRAKVKNGEMTKADYDSWKRNKVFQSKEWQQKQNDVNNILTNANQKAVDIANGKMGDVFATNANYSMYQIDNGLDMATSLYDSDTVARLIKDEPHLLPKKTIDIPKDKVWNEKSMNTQLTQSIVQGESIDKLAKRLGNVVGKDQKAMMTMARTMMTGAQNAGRLQGYREAKRIGLNVYKKWLSAHDGHTRMTHLILDDGDPVPIDEPFEVNGMEIDYPGDPYAPPALVYNCRCTMYSEILDDDGNTVYSASEEDLDEMGLNFDEWAEKREELTHLAETRIAEANSHKYQVNADLKNGAYEGSGYLTGQKYQLKGEGSTIRKIVADSIEKGVDYKQASLEMTDLLRYTNVSSPETLTSDYNKMVGYLEGKGYEVVRVKNTFVNYPKNYRGINTLVNTPDGYTFELQYHTPQSLEIKEVNHKLYEEERLLTTTKERKQELGFQMKKNAEKIEMPKNVGTIDSFDKR